jgi:hypothetical protein
MIYKGIKLIFNKFKDKITFINFFFLEVALGSVTADHMNAFSRLT